MIPLLIGVSTVAGVGLGWYGYKASLRIAAWGEKMNECDQIFQTMEEMAIGVDPKGGRSREVEDARPMAPIASRLHAGLGPLQ